jgi:hypothetical protein
MDGSWIRIIQESRMMRLPLKHQDRTEVLSVMPQQIFVATFEYLGSVRGDFERRQYQEKT